MAIGIRCTLLSQPCLKYLLVEFAVCGLWCVLRHMRRQVNTVQGNATLNIVNFISPAGKTSSRRSI